MRVRRFVMVKPAQLTAFCLIMKDTGSFNHSHTAVARDVTVVGLHGTVGLLNMFIHIHKGDEHPA